MILKEEYRESGIMKTRNKDRKRNNGKAKVGRCKICNQRKKLNSSTGLCQRCYSWYQKTGDPIIKNIGKRYIFLNVGSYSIIWDKEKQIFKSCTCKSETFGGGRCRHKALCYYYLTGLELIENPILVGEW